MSRCHPPGKFWANVLSCSHAAGVSHKERLPRLPGPHSPCSGSSHRFRLHHHGGVLQGAPRRVVLTTDCWHAGRPEASRCVGGRCAAPWQGTCCGAQRRGAQRAARGTVAELGWPSCWSAAVDGNQCWQPYGPQGSRRCEAWVLKGSAGAGGVLALGCWCQTLRGLDSH